eukprot:gene18745-22417_t
MVEIQIPPIKRVLPPHLTHLTFGAYFDQDIAPGLLPSSLIYLHFDNLNAPLCVGSIPASLTRLRFHSFYPRYSLDLIQDALPLSLTHLDIGDIGTQSSRLPLSLTHLMVRRIDQLSPGMLPPYLTHLHIKTILRTSSTFSRALFPRH